MIDHSSFILGTAMQTSSWITMVIILGIVWGGFLILLTKALRAESQKEHD